MDEQDKFDVIIIGGGPAGLSAALYSARDRYSTLILEKNGLPGGQIMLTERVENYPGFESISGPDLVQRMRLQAEKFGAKILANSPVNAIFGRDDGTIEVQINDGEQAFCARSVILAPGSDYRQLGVPGEAEMRQATKVSYCATCDGAFYRDRHIMTVGGGNTAVEDTIYLATRFARKITMIHRRDEFRAQQVLVDELQKHVSAGKIDLKTPYNLERIVPTPDGAEIHHVEIRHAQTGAVESVKVEGVFLFVGMVPNTGFLRGQVEMNEAGYIACDPATLRTSLRGVFVAGDCRQQAAMQLTTACGDGVVAAMMTKEYFRNPDFWLRPSAKVISQGW